MSYDIIGVGCVEDGNDFFTIGQLIHVLSEHPKLPVKFIGTDYTVGNMGSWRGSYDIPSITYEYCDRLAGGISHPSLKLNLTMSIMVIKVVRIGILTAGSSMYRNMVALRSIK